jgi:hypothetical protein
MEWQGIFKKDSTFIYEYELRHTLVWDSRICDGQIWGTIYCLTWTYDINGDTDRTHPEENRTCIEQHKIAIFYLRKFPW